MCISTYEYQNIRYENKGTDALDLMLYIAFQFIPCHFNHNSLLCIDNNLVKNKIKNETKLHEFFIMYELVLGSASRHLNPPMEKFVVQ